MSKPTPSRRPIFLLAYSGFVVRNLALGPFAREVRRQRPLVVAVLDPEAAEAARHAESDEEAGEGNGLQPLRFVRFPLLHWPELGTLEKAFSWRTYVYYFQLGAKGTRGMDLVRRLYDSGHSRRGHLAAAALGTVGRWLHRLRLLGLVEARYLASARSWPTTSDWCEMFRREQPAAVVSSMLTLSKKLYPSADMAPVVAARELGLPCGTLVQSWDNLTTKTAVLPSWLDRYWTWSETMNGELARLYPQLPSERFEVVGSPQFDFHSRPAAETAGLLVARDAYGHQIGLDPDRPWILIGTGTPTALPFEHLMVRELVRGLARRRPEARALVRLHPKDDGGRWPEVRGELEELGAVVRSTAPETHQDLGGIVSPAEFYGDQLNSLAHAAVVVCSSSTLTVDAALLDRPVVCTAYDVLPSGAPADELFPEGRALAFSRGSHYAPLAATGGVRVTHDRDACLEAIGHYLEDPALDREARDRLAARVSRLPVGGAGEALAREALALAGRGEAMGRHGKERGTR
ncbi:MAG: hypothetical protein MI919_06555 [Holophagales bacterium]|nr:hypothetical protein [Holophagales bacterium]